MQSKSGISDHDINVGWANVGTLPNISPTYIAVLLLLYSCRSFLVPSQVTTKNNVDSSSINAFDICQLISFRSMQNICMEGNALAKCFIRALIIHIGTWLIEAERRIYASANYPPLVQIKACRQTIIWTNAGILLIWPRGTNFHEILINIHTFSLKKMYLKMTSAKWRPFCLGLYVLSDAGYLSEHWPCTQ